MAGKNIRVMELPRNLYFVGSPVIISSTSLLTNSADRKMFVSIKMRNVTNKIITSVDAEITPLGVTGKEIGSVIGHTFANLNCARNEEFGEDTLISIPSSNPRSLSVRLTKIEFEDGSVFGVNDFEYEPIPRPRPLKSYYNEFQLATFTKLFGSNGKYLPFEYKDLRICTCGAILRSDENVCFECKSDFEKLISVDSEHLRKSGIYEKACETLNLAHSCRIHDAITEEAKIRNGVYLLFNQKNRLYTYTEDIDDTIKTYDSAKKQFESIGEWENADDKIAYCNEKTEYYNNMIAKRKEKTLADAEEMKKKILVGAKKGAKIGAIALAVILVFSFFNKILFTPLSEYKDAVEYAENGYYDEAYEILEDLGKFKDSPEKIVEIKNKEAQELLDDGNYESAYRIYNEIQNYEAIKESKLQRGIALIADKNYSYAYELLGEISGYKTADEEVKKSKYARGKVLVAQGNFKEGYALLEDVVDYADAKEILQSSKYNRATAHFAAGEFDEAYALFDQIADYKDSKAITDKSRYERGTAALAEGDYNTAYALLEKCGDYLDAKKLFSDSCYSRAEALVAEEDYKAAYALYEKVDATLYPDATAKYESTKTIADAKSKFDSGNYKAAFELCQKLQGNSVADSLATKCLDNITKIESYCGEYTGVRYGDTETMTVTYDYDTQRMNFDSSYLYYDGTINFDINNPGRKYNYERYGDSYSYYYQFTSSGSLNVKSTSTADIVTFTKVS